MISHRAACFLKTYGTVQCKVGAPPSPHAHPTHPNNNGFWEGILPNSSDVSISPHIACWVRPYLQTCWLCSLAAQVASRFSYSLLGACDLPKRPAGSATVFKELVIYPAVPNLFLHRLPSGVLCCGTTTKALPLQRQKRFRWKAHQSQLGDILR